MAKPKLAGFDINALRKEWGVVDDQPATMNSAVASMREEAVNQEAYLNSIRPRKTKKKRTVKYIRVVDPTPRNNVAQTPTGDLAFARGTIRGGLKGLAKVIRPPPVERPKRIASLAQAEKEARLNRGFDKSYTVRDGRVYYKKPGLLSRLGDKLPGGGVYGKKKWFD